MLRRLMQELGKLLRKHWAEQAACACGRDVATDAGEGAAAAV